MQKKKSKLPLVLGLVAVAGGIAYWQMNGQNVAAPADTQSVMTVSVATPQQTTLSQKVHASGLVVAREEVVVTAEISGVRILGILADEGKWVKQGQPLAELDGASAKNQLAQLDSQFKQAEQNYKRIDKIKKTGAVALSDVEEKRSLYEAAKAQRDDALLKVRLATLTAPAAGLIYERTANIGGLVGGNEPLFRIARDGAIELETLIPESDMAGLKVGGETAVTIPGRAAPITGRIRLISPRVDNATRSTRLRISLPKDASIAIGTFAEVAIAGHGTSGLVLPNTAVNLEDGKTVVWVVGPEHTVEPLPVTVSLRDGNLVMVAADGLTPATQVVAKAGPFLHAGDHVTLATETPAEETAK